MGLQSYEASFRNIREGVFCEHYEISGPMSNRQVVVKVVELLRNADFTRDSVYAKLRKIPRFR